MLLDVYWYNIGFILLTFIELIYFWWVIRASITLRAISLAWLALHACMAFLGFYENTHTLPPRLFFALFPTILGGLLWVLLSPAAVFLKNVNLERLHYIHIVRIFVEIFFLHALYLKGYIAQELTYEGNNFDIIPGVTAPLMALLFFTWRLIPQRLLLWWNIFAMLTLFFTISQAILSAPSPFQQFSFHQPTVAVFHFPFVWLPCMVAPLVLISHFISIKLLSRFSYKP